MQYNTMQYNTMQYNAMQYNVMPASSCLYFPWLVQTPGMEFNMWNIGSPGDIKFPLQSRDFLHTMALSLHLSHSKRLWVPGNILLSSARRWPVKEPISLIWRIIWEWGSFSGVLTPRSSAVKGGSSWGHGWRWREDAICLWVPRREELPRCRYTQDPGASAGHRK